MSQCPIFVSEGIFLSFRGYWHKWRDVSHVNSSTHWASRRCSYVGITILFLYKYVMTLESKQLPIGLTAQLVENGLVPGSCGSRDDQNRGPEKEKQVGLTEK